MLNIDQNVLKAHTIYRFFPCFYAFKGVKFKIGISFLFKIES